MEFSSLFFISCLLPLIVLCYYLIPDVGRRNIFLLAVSFLMFGMCQPVYIPLLVILSQVTFRMGQKVRKGRRGTVCLPVAVNLAALLLLKYADSILVQLGAFAEKGGLFLGLVRGLVEWLNSLGMTLRLPDTLAPLGFSFFVVSSVSYLLDVYRGKCAPEKCYRDFLLYLMFFPKFFQGPLVRYGEMRVQIRERRDNFRRVFDGILRFVTGLGKKVLLADYCGRIIAEMAVSKSDQALVGSWLGAVLFLLQIYYDFSGCCDMAVGLGKIFGFRLPENFKRPYLAMSVTEFWERWNVTLRAFFVDNVYDPLRNGREGSLNRFFALLLSVLMYSLWHGATFNFLIFGLYFVVILLVEHKFEDLINDLPYWLRHALTILCLMFGWVIFANRDIGSLANTIKAMIGEGGFSIAGDGARVAGSIPLIAVCWVGVTSIPGQVRRFWRGLCGVGVKQNHKDQKSIMEIVYLVSCFGYILLILWLCVISRVGSPVQPSIFMNL